MKITLLLITIHLFRLTFSFAQNFTVQSLGCLMHIGTHQLAKRFALHNEIQWRRNNIYQTHWQLLYNPGIHYYPHKDVKIGLGVGYFDTELDENLKFWEYQLWEHIILRQKVARLTVIHRYRFEHRYLQFKNNASHTAYLSRFRTQLKLVFPFGEKLYCTGYEELFISFAQNNSWEQNLAYLALGYNLNTHLKIEAGYLPHHVFITNPMYYYHTFQIACFWNIPIRKPKDEN